MKNGILSLPKRKAGFIEPMECAAVTKLLDGPGWVYEIRLDGYRAIAVKSEGKLNLFSRRRNSFNTQYPLVFEALADLPDNTLIDGEVVAPNGSGRPDFNLLQHYRTKASHIYYFVFDLLIYQNRDLTSLPLINRRQIMRSVSKLPCTWFLVRFHLVEQQVLIAILETRLERRQTSCPAHRDAHRAWRAEATK
jgi:ATP-dependent DNA ligase